MVEGRTSALGVRRNLRREGREGPQLAVYVTGAVVNAGVYYLPDGSRVEEALRAPERTASLLSGASVRELKCFAKCQRFRERFGSAREEAEVEGAIAWKRLTGSDPPRADTVVVRRMPRDHGGLGASDGGCQAAWHDEF